MNWFAFALLSFAAGPVVEMLMATAQVGKARTRKPLEQAWVIPTVYGISLG